MPGYTCSLKELLKMISREEVTLDNIETYLDCAKSEYKGYDEAKDELKLENNDTNRPDLWSLEGTARQILSVHFGVTREYDFFEKTPGMDARILASRELEGKRPFIAGFSVSGIEVSESLLDQLIQAQEKLCDNFGRRRELIAIGVYDSDLIKFPIHYVAADPDKSSFAPLGFDERMTMREVLERHPKGIQYGGIVSGFDRMPLITDDNGSVLSFPPIINSNDLGKVKVGDKNLFVEVTGTDMDAVLLAANIMAVNIADHGGVISPFETVYEDGRRVKSPFRFEDRTMVTREFAEKLSGCKIETGELERLLRRMGHRTERKGEAVECTPPPYRRDILHMSDLVEDYCIALGYNNIEPQMPGSFTVGSESEKALEEKTIRELMIGMGFQEMMTYILTAKESQTDRMRLPGEKIVEIGNPMTETYGVVRKSLIPILLEIESKNPRAEYPHKIFETGETAELDPSLPEKAATRHKAAALIVHGSSNFSEISSALQALMYYLGRDYSLVPAEHPSFIPGRSGYITRNGKNIGVIGEIHPEVLENWSIAMPCSAFEMTL